MTRTRGGGHTNPTVFVCRHERRAVADKEQEIYEALKHVAANDVVFGGGPENISILTEYANHVTCKLWDGLVYQ